MANEKQSNTNEEQDTDGLLLQAHHYLQKNYPLAYEAAQVFPPVGIAGGALDVVDAIKKKDPEGVAKGILSMVPVLGKARVGSKIATSVRAASGAAPNSTKKEIAKKLFKKSAAGENVAEAGDAGYEEGKLRKEQLSNEYKRGGSVKAKSHRGDGIAKRGKTKGRMI